MSVMIPRESAAVVAT